MTGAGGRRLFTFAVISDTHVNEAEDRSASPFASNRLANGRLRWVVRELNRRTPAFTAHLGDMGNPLPELATYRQAAANFHALVAELRSPLRLVPGNHCVGDKPGGWVPVPRVGQESLALYKATYGRSFHAFDHGPCRFVAVNSLLVNSGLEAESAQKRWLEDDLAKASGEDRRIWLLMHYPPYVASPDEPGSYDNVDEPGRSWLLDLLERFDVEAVLTGHVHNYFHNRHAGTDIYTVPATSFVRQDYSELFQIEPADEEGGRNDLAKLGYCLVDVHEQGHRLHVVRTRGQVLAPDDRTSAERPTAAPAHPATSVTPALGAELRENWLATVALRTNNSTSPFTRRWARNDWAVLALDEMGVKRVRLALQELIKDDVVERMATLQEAGFRFTAYSHGLPGDRDQRLIRRHRSLLAGWELILSRDQIGSGRIEKLARDAWHDGKLPCYLNEVRDITKAGIDDANVKHEANYGFQPSDRALLERLIGRGAIRDAFAGFVFRLRRKGVPEVTPWHAIREIARMGREWGMRNQVSVLFSGSLTSERLVDDASTANRVAESAVAAAVAGNVDLTFDTFEDVDRGYFVRHGLVDRRFNPRLPARVLRHLGAALAGLRASDVVDCSASEAPDCRLLSVGLTERFLVLVLPRGAPVLREIARVGGRAGGTLRVLDLETGAPTRVSWSTDGSRLRLDEALTVTRPLLLIGAAGGGR